MKKVQRKIVGIIPARYGSGRFAGKPLADINGKPMIWWVYQQAIKVKNIDDVYVATDDERIMKLCSDNNMNVIMTSTKHKTGTDRVCEAAESIDADLYIVIMGDEPLILSKDIETLVSEMSINDNYNAGMLAKKYNNPVDVMNPTTIKLAINDNEELIYMSRAAIPFPKASLDYHYYKNIGVYAFTKESLNFYRNTKIGRLEAIEDMEMLRMLENHKIVKVVKIESDSFSVDTPKDLERIKIIMKNRK